MGQVVRELPYRRVHHYLLWVPSLLALLERHQILAIQVGLEVLAVLVVQAFLALPSGQ